ncbi:MAG TPA: histidine kinase [Cellvibrio sp.]|nr:histidine kinase [Cellvibrio sp.]
MKNEHVLLTLAGVFTWLLVAYVELERLSGSPYILLSALGYLLFLICFLPIGTGYSRKFSPRYSQVLLMGQVLVALALLVVHHGPVAPVLLVVWAGQLPDFFTRRLAFIQVTISALSFYFIMLFCWVESYPVITSLIYLGFQLFALSSSFARVSERNARERVEQLNQQLQATRILLAQSSRQDERVRIARDLHDILGHQLTALNLQLEILQHKVPDELRETVQQSKGLAKELLENIRQVVRDQRNLLSLDIRQAVQALVVHIPQLEMQIEGELQLDSVQLAEQIVLCIQEGISNALRHGQATSINLMLEQQSNEIKISLEDNGSGLIAGLNNGTGLQGMRERLAPYAGVVELSAPVQGCRLAISLHTGIKEFVHD